MVHPPWHQQIVDHVERQQRLHRIIREPLAPLGEAQIPEALRMAEKGAVVVVDLFEVGRCFGDRHGCTLPMAA